MRSICASSMAASPPMRSCRLLARKPWCRYRSRSPIASASFSSFASCEHPHLSQSHTCVWLLGRCAPSSLHPCMMVYRCECRCTVWSTGRSCATGLASAALGGAGGAGSLAAKGGCSAEPFSSCGGGGPFLHQDSAVMHVIQSSCRVLFPISSGVYLTNGHRHSRIGAVAQPSVLISTQMA